MHLSLLLISKRLKMICHFSFLFSYYDFPL
jgi:hypothetical protein